MASDKPYCACATPPGVSGIALIRMAGDGASTVADRVFVLRRAALGAKSVSEMQGYTVAYGHIVHPETHKIIDEVMLTRFTAPHSYTGEDAIEISCHGGTAVRQEILRVLLLAGARMALPGEFTRKAFAAGKIDLTQAESVMDVIAADSAMALEAAESQLMGTVKKEVRRISSSIYAVFAAMEMMVEFPHEEEYPQDDEKQEAALQAILHDMDMLIGTFSQGRILKEKMTTVLVGVPNSGKSSLLNRIAGFERAIVTSVPGTTRDTLEVDTTMGGVPIRLIDTAGIRGTEDEVEAIGVNRAKKATGEADIVFWLVSSENFRLEEHEEMIGDLAKLSKNTKLGLLISKSDTGSNEANDAVQKAILSSFAGIEDAHEISFIQNVSATTGEGIDAMCDMVKAVYDALGVGHGQEVIITSERHHERLRAAQEHVKEALRVLSHGEPKEIVCLLLRTAMEEIGEITGDSVSEKLVDTIFSRFCIGK